MNNFVIKSIKAKQIKDSKGMPTVEAELFTNFGKFKSSVPSGVSTGKYEAVELRDEDGKGVKKAVESIEKVIAPVLIKENSFDQKIVDEILINLDGTRSKSRLGGNAILAVSIAICRAGAKSKNIPLYSYLSQISGTKIEKMPKPSFNMIEGGKHGGSGLAFQEFMIVPQKESFKENLEIGVNIYKNLKKVLEKKFGKKNIKLSKESAFSTPIEKVTDALDFLLQAAESAGYKNDIKIAIDAAACSFYQSGNYSVDGKILKREELSDFYEKIAADYPMVSVEDPFSEDDLEGFKILKEKIGKKVTIIGDDFLTTNIQRMEMAKNNNACNGLLLKPNQIGTVSEAISAGLLAKQFNWQIMVSNRAGETMDDFIADIAVGLDTEFIKSGAPFAKERMVKYNRLVEIEKQLENK